MEDSISLREYIDLKYNDIKQSTELARNSMDKRLDGMNEFRETLKDQASRFITRTEIDSKMEVVYSNIKNLEISKATLEGKASQSSLTFTIIMSVLGLIIAIISLIYKML